MKFMDTATHTQQPVLMSKDISRIHLMRLLQFSDSAFPVGSFSFSNGLETAVHEGIVWDADTLREYVQTIAVQQVNVDGVAALQAHRSALQNDSAGILKADRQLWLMKTNHESRQMLCRMGYKMVQLGQSLVGNSSLLDWWNLQIVSRKTAGTYPVSQALVFALAGLSEEELFCSQLYGTMNMVLNAALRCMKVSHLDTQRILYELGSLLPAFCEEAQKLSLEEMHVFLPQMEIVASLHEKGHMRLFMN